MPRLVPPDVVGPHRTPRMRLTSAILAGLCVATALMALATVGPVLTPADASAPPTVDRTALSRYLISQLDNAEVYEPFGPGLPDYGLTMDAILALSAVGGHDATVHRMTDSVAAQVASYGDPKNTAGAFDGGSVGKLALTAEVTGRDPRAFGGYDLIAALGGNVCTAAQVAKDATTCPGVGIYRGVTSTFGQSLGLLGQARAGGAPSSAVEALIGTQCPDGAFHSILPATSACASADDDVDSTSIAAQALSAAGGHTTAVDAAIGWLAGRQLNDGGFPGAAGDNTNSAALAIQAMTMRTPTYAARIAAAQAFLATRQNRSDGGLGTNTTSDGRASDPRASTQGLSGVVGTGFATLTRAAPSGTAGPAATSAAARGAGYLASNAILTGGTHVQSGGFVDYGLTADIAIALAAAGGHDARLKALVGYLRAHVADYADPDARIAGFPGPYSGGLAKLALLAEITGQNPHAFGGYDLLGVLRARQCPAANAAGTCTATGDFYQAFSGVSQALGVLALARAGTVKADDPAVRRLLELQCPDGGFSSTLPPAAVCVPEVDTTGFALQALSLVRDQSGAQTSPVADALLRGQDYVLSVRRPDGSFPGAAGNNTNSSALAVEALLAAPAQRRPALESAATAVSGTPGGAGIRGGLSFLAGGQNGDGGFGINAHATTSDARASAQVVPALLLSELSQVSRPVTLPAFVAAPTTGATTGSSSPSTSRSASASTRSTSSATVVTTLAATGIGRAALEDELLAALLLCVGGAAMIVLGTRRRPHGRHR